MFRPTRRLLLLLAAGCALAAVPSLAGADWWWAWLLQLGVLLTLLLLDALLLVRPREVQFTLTAPPVLYVGSEDPLRLEVAAPARLRRVDVALHCHGVLPVPDTVVLPLQDGRGEHVLRLRPRRRGQGGIGGAHLRWPSPFGLLHREHWRPLAIAQRALPDVRAVKQQALRFFAAREFQAGLKIEQFVGDGSEFDALREYVPGLDRRAVDWKASARHRKLLARQYRAERNHQIVLAVDAGVLMGEPLAGTLRQDHAINAALQLAYVGLRSGDLVGVHAFADRPLRTLPPEGGVAALAGIQQMLADLDYGSAETNFTLGLGDLLLRTRRRSLVVLFTDFTDSITAELMVQNVLRVARRHLLLFVALRDPQLAQLAHRPPAGGLDLQRAVVAAEMLRERELVLQRIRTAGAMVIDVAAGEVGTALINRYLDVKRREAV